MDKTITARELARQALREAFQMPTAGDAVDVPCGFVPWSMQDLERYCGDFLNDNATDYDTGAAAWQMIQDYFRRCK